MKKVLELILCAVLIFSATALTACEDKDDELTQIGRASCRERV